MNDLLCGLNLIAPSRVEFDNVCHKLTKGYIKCKGLKSLKNLSPYIEITSTNETKDIKQRFV